jgi:sugar/nucleoside kinase (ribokinase family)
MSLLVVGTLAFDSVKTPFGERDDVLGGSASFLSTAASYFTEVRMVGVIGEDFPKDHLSYFKKRGIDTAGVTTLPGRTFRWRGRYDHNLNVAHTLETQLNVLSDFRPELPPSFRDSRYVVLGNIDPDLQMRVLDQVKSPKLIACDTMNFWIDKKRPELERALKRVDLLSINDGEARQLSGEYNLVKAAQVIRAMGPKIIVVKRGEHGALLFLNGSIFAAPAFLLESVLDPTGAGDSFAGGMMGVLSKLDAQDPATLRQAVVMGGVLASFAVEDFSLERIKNLSQDEIASRFAEYKKLTHFESEAARLWA